MMPDLKRSDLENPRTAREFYEWVRHIHEECGRTAEGKTAMRLRSGLYKKFREEIWPLANYAWRFFRDRSDVLFQPVIGSQPGYDALLVDKSGSTLRRFQITQALDEAEGYQERLRLEHLDAFRRAPQTGPALKRLASGSVAETPAEFVAKDDAIEAIIRRIRNAIEMKGGKPHSDDTVLIVEFEDSVFFRNPEDQRLLDRVTAYTLCGLATGFSELALIGETGEFGLRHVRPTR
jgi:hypothetical protein